MILFQFLYIKSLINIPHYLTLSPPQAFGRGTIPRMTSQDSIASSTDSSSHDVVSKGGGGVVVYWGHIVLKFEVHNNTITTHLSCHFPLNCYPSKFRGSSVNRLDHKKVQAFSNNNSSLKCCLFFKSYKTSSVIICTCRKKMYSQCCLFVI